QCGERLMQPGFQEATILGKGLDYLRSRLGSQLSCELPPGPVLADAHKKTGRAQMDVEVAHVEPRHLLHLGRHFTFARRITQAERLGRVLEDLRRIALLRSAGTVTGL